MVLYHRINLPPTSATECWTKNYHILPTMLYLIAIMRLLELGVSAQQSDLHEYCEAETFKPVCQSGEVVVMRTGRYGRMRVSKCVRTDYGYVGCFKDVLPHLDSKCSGRRTCSMRIPDKELDETNPCPAEFKTYLEVSSDCVRVESAECKMCQTSTHATLTSERGYLASVVTGEDESGCGSARCPWRIQLAPGQTVNLTLFDFGRAANIGLHGLLESCFRYAVVKEKGSRDKPICGGKTRERHIMLSKSHEIEIHVVSPTVLMKRGLFMLYYEAVGCPKLEAPKNSWAKQEGDVYTYGCLGSSDSWSLRCKGTTWEGTMGTCEAIGEVSQGPNTLTLSLGVLIAIIVAIALVIGVFILTVGLVCLKRQQHNNIRRQDASVYLRTRRESDYPEDIPSATLPLQYTKKEEAPEEDLYKTRAGPHGNIRENVYMESRPLPQIPVMGQPGGGGSGIDGDDDARSEKSSKVQVYRTSSGREHYHNPRLVITPRPTPPNSAEMRDDPQYFVLDPDEVNGGGADMSPTPIAEASCGSHSLGAGCSSGMPPPPLRRIARGVPSTSGVSGIPGMHMLVQSDKQKSPEEENAENFCKEVSNTSCQDLPALQHYETSVDCHNNHGNSSWP